MTNTGTVRRINDKRFADLILNDKYSEAKILITDAAAQGGEQNAESHAGVV